MSIKPILNNPDALNRKNLNLFCNEITANNINGGEVDLTNITCETLTATTSITTPQGNIDNVESNNIDTDNINTTTINNQPYPQANLPSSSVFILDPNIGASEYNPLPTDTYASNYYMVDGTGLQSITIKTIGVGLYNGFSIRIGVLAAAICNVVINHNDPSQNQAEQKYPILINNFSNITLNPINPTNFQYVELVYNDNYAGTGDRVWVCSQIKS